LGVALSLLLLLLLLGRSWLKRENRVCQAE
jgi:hypothetical protein